MSVIQYYDIFNNKYTADITSVKNDIVKEKVIFNDRIKLKMLMIVDPQTKYKETYTITLYTDTFKFSFHSYLIITGYKNADDKSLAALGDSVYLNLHNITDFVRGTIKKKEQGDVLNEILSIVSPIDDVGSSEQTVPFKNLIQQ